MPSVRFRIAGKTKSATLSGVNYQDLRSVFDAAAINFHDDLEKLRSRKRRSRDDREAAAWIRNQLKVLELIRGAVDAGIAATYPGRPPRPPTKSERLEAVTKARKERELIEGLLERSVATLRRTSGTPSEEAR